MDNELIDNNLGNGGIQFTTEIKSFLSETAKWSKFLAILGFIGIGFMVLLGIFMSFFMGAFMSDLGDASPFGAIGGGFIGGIYIVIALVYLLPILYLYRFGANLKTALDRDDQQSLHDGFMNLKKHYKFIGIFAAVIIALYALLFVISIFAGIFMS